MAEVEIPASPRTSKDFWSEKEVSILKEFYSSASTSWSMNLQDLADQLDRSKSNVCRKARQLGLTNNARKKTDEPKRRAKFSSDEERRKARSERMKLWLQKNGHPRGALGMKHTEETKEKISKTRG